jgi:hypothetical protein
LRDRTFGIIEITKNYRLSRTRLRTCWLYVAVSYRSIVFSRFIFRTADSLHTESAFFHDALPPNSDIWIDGLLKRCIPLGRTPIKVTHRIGARLGAGACTDAPWVNLCVEPFRVFVGRRNGTNTDAGSIVTVHTEHRHKASPHVRKFTFIVSLHSHPLNRSPNSGLFWTSGSDIVFSPASNHACFTSVTSI